jgi:hypothetical protein
MAKAAYWDISDTERRQRGEQTGLDTLVVHALNYVNWLSEEQSFGNEANA